MSGPGGFLHMLPADVEQAAHRMRVRAQELSDGWPGHESAIAGLESAIGTDVVGVAFRRGYDEEVAAVKGSARTVTEWLHRDADTGTISSAHYTDMDLRSLNEFQRQSPGPGVRA
jgi:hypothetical protein